MSELQDKYLAYLQEENAPLKIPYIECVKELTEKIPVTYEAISNMNSKLSDYDGSPT
jgi:hypothetical protein